MTRMLILATVALLCGAIASPAAILTVVPPVGSVFTGSTVGFGYILQNDDPSSFYVPTSVSYSVSGGGTLIDLFDYPVVAPSEVVNRPYTGTEGLVALVVPPSAPTGAFSLDYLITGDLYSGNPLLDSNAQPVGAAADLSGSVIFTQVFIPEPSTGFLMAGGVVLLGLLRQFTGKA